jgi:hypothetical protein
MKRSVDLSSTFSPGGRSVRRRTSLTPLETVPEGGGPPPLSRSNSVASALGMTGAEASYPPQGPGSFQDTHAPGGSVGGGSVGGLSTNSVPIDSPQGLAQFFPDKADMLMMMERDEDCIELQIIMMDDVELDNLNPDELAKRMFNKPSKSVIAQLGPANLESSKNLLEGLQANSEATALSYETQVKEWMKKESDIAGGYELARKACEQTTFTYNNISAKRTKIISNKHTWEKLLKNCKKQVKLRSRNCLLTSLGALSTQTIL